MGSKKQHILIFIIFLLFLSAISLDVEFEVLKRADTEEAVKIKMTVIRPIMLLTDRDLNSVLITKLNRKEKKILADVNKIACSRPKKHY